MSGSEDDYKIVGFFEQSDRGMTLDPDAEIVFSAPEPRPDEDKNALKTPNESEQRLPK